METDQQQEEISRLLSTHDESESEKQKSRRAAYRERILQNQLIRGWCCYVDGGDPAEDSGFEPNTKLHKQFRRGYNEAEMWHKGWAKPHVEHDDELLDKEIPATNGQTIRDCVESLRSS